MSSKIINAKRSKTECFVQPFDVVFWVYMQMTWYSPVQLCRGLHKQQANENRGDRRSWSSNMPRMPMHRMYSTNRCSPYLVCINEMTCKQIPKVNSLYFCCFSLSWDSVRCALVVCFRVFSSNWIPHCCFRHKCYTCSFIKLCGYNLLVNNTQFSVLS